MADDQRLPEHVANAQKELRIREKAYQLWEADGSPQGKSDEYWHMAREIIENEIKTAPGEVNGSETRDRFLKRESASFSEEIAHRDAALTGLHPVPKTPS